MKHKHAELIHAWADGAKIQFLDLESGIWIDTERPHWFDKDIYRIKPKDKEFMLGFSCNDSGIIDIEFPTNFPNAKVVFDSETKKLKYIEML